MVKWVPPPHSKEGGSWSSEGGGSPSYPPLSYYTSLYLHLQQSDEGGGCLAMQLRKLWVETTRVETEDGVLG